MPLNSSVAGWTCWRAFPLLCFGVLLIGSNLLYGQANTSADELERLFLHPPVAARPRVLWMWMGSNVSRQGITRDLEALRDAGFGGATLFSLADVCTPWAASIHGGP